MNNRARFIILMGHSAGAHPVLAVCSTRRNDPCPQAMRFAAKASSRGMRVAVLEQDLSRRDINRRLALENRQYSHKE